jgi:hypothetical protein
MRARNRGHKGEGDGEQERGRKSVRETERTNRKREKKGE